MGKSEQSGLGETESSYGQPTVELSPEQLRRIEIETELSALLPSEYKFWHELNKHEKLRIWPTGAYDVKWKNDYLCVNMFNEEFNPYRELNEFQISRLTEDEELELHEKMEEWWTPITDFPFNAKTPEWLRFTEAAIKATPCVGEVDLGALVIDELSYLSTRAITTPENYDPLYSYRGTYYPGDNKVSRFQVEGGGGPLDMDEPLKTFQVGSRLPRVTAAEMWALPLSRENETNEGIPDDYKYYMWDTIFGIYHSLAAFGRDIKAHWDGELLELDVPIFENPLAYLYPSTMPESDPGRVIVRRRFPAGYLEPRVLSRPWALIWKDPNVKSIAGGSIYNVGIRSLTYGSREYILWVARGIGKGKCADWLAKKGLSQLSPKLQNLAPKIAGPAAIGLGYGILGGIEVWGSKQVEKRLRIIALQEELRALEGVGVSISNEKIEMPEVSLDWESFFDDTQFQQIQEAVDRIETQERAERLSEILHPEPEPSPLFNLQNSLNQQDYRQGLKLFNGVYLQPSSTGNFGFDINMDVQLGRNQGGRLSGIVGGTELSQQPNISVEVESVNDHPLDERVLEEMLCEIFAEYSNQ